MLVVDHGQGDKKVKTDHPTRLITQRHANWRKECLLMEPF